MTGVGDNQPSALVDAVCEMTCEAADLEQVLAELLRLQVAEADLTAAQQECRARSGAGEAQRWVLASSRLDWARQTGIFSARSFAPTYL